MYVLGIETSCDETATAIYHQQQGLLSHKLHSQITMHQNFGGVVPELAARDHLSKLKPLVSATLADAGITMQDLAGIAYTKGPGLIGALLVGSSFAKSLGYALNIPTLGIHHMEGHLLAPLLETNAPEPPLVALLVSGGHTLLVAVEQWGKYEILGQSIDDAAGEAFDKTAKILGLPYPGGPELAKLAELGSPDRFTFPRPMTQRPGLDFSFSGLKTHSWQTFAKTEQSQQDKCDIAYAFETAVVDTLIIKCKRALEQTGYKRLVIAGGVSKNTRLRNQLSTELAADQQLYCPSLEYCTDNAAMIAVTGAMRLAQGERDQDLTIATKPRWSLAELTPIKPCQSSAQYQKLSA